MNQVWGSFIVLNKFQSTIQILYISNGKLSMNILHTHAKVSNIILAQIKLRKISFKAPVA